MCLSNIIPTTEIRSKVRNLYLSKAMYDANIKIACQSKTTKFTCPDGSVFFVPNKGEHISIRLIFFVLFNIYNISNIYMFLFSSKLKVNRRENGSIKIPAVHSQDLHLLGLEPMIQLLKRFCAICLMMLINKNSSLQILN